VSVEEKGVVVGNIDGTDVTYEFVKIPARPMVRVLIDLRGAPITDHVRIIKQTVKRANVPDDALVRVIVQADDYSHVDQEAIRLALSRVYRIAAIISDVQKVTTARLDGIDDITSLTPMELVEEWLLGTDTTDDDIDAVLDIFEGILEDFNGIG